jgi:multiple sugar transport system substrate-binding protein
LPCAKEKSEERLISFWFTLLLSFCLALPLLSACQSADKSAIETLSLSAWGSQQETAVLRRLIQRFEQRHSQIRVRLIHIPDNYFQKLHLLVAGDLAPDVMMMNSLSYPVYAPHGVFRDLRPFLAQDHELKRSDFYSQALQAFQKEPDQPLGVLPRDLSNLVVYYNKDQFQQAGIPIPKPGWTWQDLISTAQALSRTNRGEAIPHFGLSFYAKPPLYWLPFVWSAGGRLWNPDTGQFVLDKPAALRGLQFYADLRHRYHIAPTRAQSGDAVMSQLFLQQKLAMLISGRWSVPVLREQAKFRWDVVPLPVGPSGQSRVGVDASGYAISAKSRHVQSAWTLLKFLESTDSLREITRTGLIIPARPDLARELLSMPPDHADAFLQALDHGVPTQVPSRWNEFSEVLQVALEPVWDGQKSPAAALREARSELQRLLREERQP